MEDTFNKMVDYTAKVQLILAESLRESLDNQKRLAQITNADGKIIEAIDKNMQIVDLAIDNIRKFMKDTYVPEQPETD